MAQQRYSQETMIEALRKARGLKSVAARILSCHRNTIQEYCDRFPRVAAVVQEERESMIDIGEAALYTKVQAGEGWAVCFFLKTQAKDRGYVERQEHSNPPGEEFRVAVEPKSWKEAVQSFMPPEGPSADTDAS
jgi:hypothetical protein